jgi:SAM-dependent methyltransferase
MSGGDEPGASGSRGSGSPSEDVIGLYRRHATAFMAARSIELVERAWLDRFLEVAGRGGHILDLGCGSGQPIAAYLDGCGHPVTGVDSSPELLAAFAKVVPGATAILGDMRTVPLEGTFAGILAWDSLFHLTQDDQRAALVRLETHAAPGAALMFNSGPDDGIAIGSFEDEPLFHASLGPTAYRSLLQGLGFALLDHRVEDPTCGGRTIWLCRKAH